MYKPKQIDTSDVILSNYLLALKEKNAKKVHDVWVTGRIAEGWTYGEKRDHEKRRLPCLFLAPNWPESEREYDRNTALEALKLIFRLR